MKKCHKCGETKLRDEFAKNSARKDGLQTYCKSCHSDSKNKYENTEGAKLLRARRRKVYNQRFEVRLRNHQYRAMMRGDVEFGSIITKGQWHHLIEICDGKCMYC